MKWLKIWFLVSLILLTTVKSYPQTMLKTYELGLECCSEEIVDKVYKEKNNYLDINVIVPQFNNLSNKKQQDLINNKITSLTETSIDEVKSVADEYFKDRPSPLVSYQLYGRYKVTNNSDIISFYIDYYQFTGGAHGMTTRFAYNIDKSTGKEVKLKDIFKEGFEYKDIINKEINRQISKDPDRYFPGKDGFVGISEDQSFYIKNNTLIIYFGLYEIAPYASGISEFIIPNNLLEENFKYDKIK